MTTASSFGFVIVAEKMKKTVNDQMGSVVGDADAALGGFVA